VYQEYIADKQHVHMNSTRWETLTGFIMYLGRTGKAKVDNTEKGWYITWIDREPETIARQEALAKKERLDKDDEERMADFVKKQVERAKESVKDLNEPEYTELLRSSEEEKLQLDLKIGSAKFAKPADPPAKLSKSVFQQTSSKDRREDRKSESDKKRKKSALEEIREEEERRKKRIATEQTRESMAGSSKQSETKEDRGWMRRNIVVKIVTKSLGDKYYKQKGYVKEMVDEFTGIVVMLDSGAKIKLDQDHVETVIPAEGKPVLVLKGRYRGEVATLHSIDIEAFEASLKLEDGTRISLPYEYFSKIHTDS
jgi:DNA/RNA-binding protein KIN17